MTSKNNIDDNNNEDDEHDANIAIINVGVYVKMTTVVILLILGVVLIIILSNINKSCTYIHSLEKISFLIELLITVAKSFNLYLHGLSTNSRVRASL